MGVIITLGMAMDGGAKWGLTVVTFSSFLCMRLQSMTSPEHLFPIFEQAKKEKKNQNPFFSFLNLLIYY